MPPLTVLAGFVETLVQLPLSDAERRRVLAMMEQQTDRMQVLVNDLLTLALTVLADLTVAIGVGVGLGLALRLRESRLQAEEWHTPER